MSNVHIYTAPLQSATQFVDRNIKPPIWHRNKPRTPIHCWACWRRRWAKYLRVQVYYDSIRFWCAPGRGCKKER